MGKLLLTRPDASPAEIRGERATIGRDAACELRVDDKSVSRRHALVERRGEAWYVVDQGSANGTRVDGRRVAEAELADGQVLRLGNVALGVVIEEEVPATVLMAAPVFDPDATRLLAQPALEPVTPPPAHGDAGASASGARERAAARLGLAAGASSWEIKARYDELSSDLEQRIAGAATAHLRSTWQRNLDELREAVRLLAPDVLLEYSASDLPSAQPVVVPELIDQSLYGKRAAASAPEKLAPPSPAASGSVLPAATARLAAFAMLMVAVIAFFTLSTGKSEAEIRRRESDAAFVQARLDATRLAPIEQLLRTGALRNGRLRLCNRTSQPVEIAWLGAVYARPTPLLADADAALARAASGFELATYNSAFCGREFELTLAAGEEREVRFGSQDPRCAWDGAFLFWSLAAQRPGQADAVAGPVWLSGVSSDGRTCVALDGGW